MERYIRRVALPSQMTDGRVTVGKVYQLNERGVIIDDNGNPMRPRFNNPDYWKKLNQKPEKYPDSPTTTNEEPNMSKIIGTACTLRCEDDLPSYIFPGKEYELYDMPNADNYAGYIIDEDGDKYEIYAKDPQYDFDVVLNTGNGNMTKVENAVLINGNVASRYDNDDLLRLIRDEQKALESLEAMNIESKTVAKMVEKRKENIKQLIEVLDSREQDV